MSVTPQEAVTGGRADRARARPHRYRRQQRGDSEDRLGARCVDCRLGRRLPREPVGCVLLLQSRARVDGRAALRQDRQHRVRSGDERRRLVRNVLYGTTKAGVVALTKGLARELAPFGINVNAIAPGVVETRHDKHTADAGTSQSRARREFRWAASLPPATSRTSLHCWRPTCSATSQAKRSRWMVVI